MRPGNVEVDGLTHAHAYSERAVTRCGLRYLRPGTIDALGTHVGLVLRLSVGVETKEDVNCMTCMTKSEWENADLSEIMIGNSVKDIEQIVNGKSLEQVLEQVLKFAKDVR